MIDPQAIPRVLQPTVSTGTIPWNFRGNQSNYQPVHLEAFTTQDAKLPPRAKLFGGKGLDVLQSKLVRGRIWRIFEHFLAQIGDI